MADSDRPDGEELADKAADAAQRMKDGAGDKLKGAAGVVGGAAGAVGGKLSGAKDAVGDAAEAVGDKFGDAAEAGGKLSGAAGAAGGKLSGAAGAAGGKLSGAAGSVGDVAGAAGGKLSGAAGSVSDVAGAAGGKLSGAAGSVGGKVAGAAGAASLASAAGGRGGWRSFVPPNSNGKFPWKLRWLGVPLILGACMLTAMWGWNKMETGLNERALVHLDCEGIDRSGLDLDWSYRSVTVDGQLPEGVTANQIEQIIDNGSSNATCLDNAGINPDDDPGVYNIAVPAAAAAAIAAVPDPDPTPVPAPTATAVPEPTATPEPEPTATPEPEPTEAPEPVIAALAASAAYDGQQITLTGLVGSEEQRAALVAAAVAAVGEANVADELQIADGDPSDSSAARIEELAATIAAFGGPNVIQGEASIDDAALTYDLLAPSDEAKRALDLAGTGTVDVPDAPAPSFTG